MKQEKDQIHIILYYIIVYVLNNNKKRLGHNHVPYLWKVMHVYLFILKNCLYVNKVPSEAINMSLGLSMVQDPHSSKLAVSSGTEHNTDQLQMKHIV